MKKAFIILILILGVKTYAQNWAPLDTGINAWFPFGLMADSANNNLIAFGSYYPSSTYPSGFAGLTVWNNNKWNQWYPNRQFGVDIGVPYFNNKTLIFRPFYDATDGNKPKTRIYRFSNATDLDSLQTMNGTWDVGLSCFYQGKLITPLYISNDNSFLPHCIASYDGTNFVSIGDPSWGGTDAVYSPCVFNGELYALLRTSTINGLAKYTGSGWQAIGGSILGGGTFYKKLLVYKNRLYVCGGFWKVENANNPGNGIAAWDGTKWDGLGGGVLNPANYLNSYIVSASVCNNKLFVTGLFTSISGVKGSRIASWNDTSWCMYGKDLDLCTNFMGNVVCLNDTPYVAGIFNKMYTNNNYGFVAKLRGKNNTDTCSGPFLQGIQEIINLKFIKIYPNPTTNTLHIETEQNEFENSEIEITNTLGQTVLKLPYSNTIDVSELSHGFYSLKISSKSNEFYYSKFIKE